MEKNNPTKKKKFPLTDPEIKAWIKTWGIRGAQRAWKEKFLGEIFEHPSPKKLVRLNHELLLEQRENEDGDIYEDEDIDDTETAETTETLDPEFEAETDPPIIETKDFVTVERELEEVIRSFTSKHQKILYRFFARLGERMFVASSLIR